MTDALDSLAEHGVDQMVRVDAALSAHGLPAGHPVAGLLRRLGALPADALDAILALRAAPLRAAATDLRRTAAGYSYQRDLLATPAEWAGSAGERFAAYRDDLVAHLGSTGDPDEQGLVGRLRGTADYLDDVATWVERSRRDMAVALAEVLGSIEATRLRTGRAGGTTASVGAAATVGARVLTAAADAHAIGLVLAERWAGRLAEVPYRCGADGAGEGCVGAAGETRLAL
ncbi:MAG: hypothetical protein QOE03_2964 [Micromonosporaceae bacterium]|nr:hypothetical protein [Micromonosporaceae bacterium]